MGYKPFGKIKNIVLPVPDSEITLDQYKERYGIDLKEFIKLNSDSGTIVLSFPDNTCVYLDVKDALEFYGYDDCLLGIVPVTKSDPSTSAWDEGSTDGYNGLVAYSFILIFKIYKNDAFSIENMKVYAGEF